MPSSDVTIGNAYTDTTQESRHCSPTPEEIEHIPNQIQPPSMYFRAIIICLIGISNCFLNNIYASGTLQIQNADRTALRPSRRVNCNDQANCFEMKTMSDGCSDLAKCFPLPRVANMKMRAASDAESYTVPISNLCDENGQNCKPIARTADALLEFTDNFADDDIGGDNIRQSPFFLSGEVKSDPKLTISPTLIPLRKTDLDINKSVELNLNNIPEVSTEISSTQPTENVQEMESKSNSEDFKAKHLNLNVIVSPEAARRYMNTDWQFKMNNDPIEAFLTEARSKNLKIKYTGILIDDLS